MVSKHYFSEKGATAENVIHTLANQTFFSDWCYPNPKRQDGKELCDLLVVFDDIAIIWQIKDLKANEAGAYKQAEVEKNLRQLGGARRYLFDVKKSMMLDNPRRGAELFESASIKRIYLISVLMGDGIGPFSLMDVVKEHALHIFTREFADIVLGELNTVADFCAYLQAKEELGEVHLILAGGEENLLASYLGNDRSFDSLKQHDFVVIDDSLWPHLTSLPEYIAKKREDEISSGWDSLIEVAHTCGKGYEEVARQLARTNRFERRVLSKAFLEIYAEFRKSTHGMLRRKLALGDTTYCFLISSEPEERRAQRKQMLELMCFVARGLDQERKRVIGVATDRDNRNYDFVFMFVPNWSAKQTEYMHGIQKDLGIFASPRVSEAHEDEYPDR